ncbi:hypothetical protein [Roseomonas fluvialis]|nr:hypothetical protein [Roseomonas fluvialis]
MGSATAPCPDLASALAAFPEHVAFIRRLFLADRAFRSACEDYRLACEGLATFGRLACETPRPEVADYQRLVRELEAEMRSMIHAARGRA